VNDFVAHGDVKIYLILDRLILNKKLTIKIPTSTKIDSAINKQKWKTKKA
jgi:hypothetical protein